MPYNVVKPIWTNGIQLRDRPEVCQLFKLSKDISQNCLETLFVQCFYFDINNSFISIVLFNLFILLWHCLGIRL